MWGNGWKYEEPGVMHRLMYALKFWRFQSEKDVKKLMKTALGCSNWIVSPLKTTYKHEQCQRKFRETVIPRNAATVIHTHTIHSISDVHRPQSLIWCIHWLNIAKLTTLHYQSVINTPQMQIVYIWGIRRHMNMFLNIIISPIIAFMHYNVICNTNEYLELTLFATPAWIIIYFKYEARCKWHDLETCRLRFSGVSTISFIMT